MATISESVTIAAKREVVFGLISRVEEFPLYANHLKKVEKIGYCTYRWLARVHGFTLSWDSKITEFRRPARLAWRSVRGFDNSGAYDLTSVAGGTKVDLSIDYSFEGIPLGGLMELLVTPVTRAAATEVLRRVKERLERHRFATGEKRNSRPNQKSTTLAPAKSRQINRQARA